MTEEGFMVCQGKDAMLCECYAACFMLGGGACNPDTGFCECAADDECNEGFACVPL